MKIFEFWTKSPTRRGIVGLATLGPLGWLGPAPGTNGSLVGLVWFWFCFYPVNIYGQAALLAASGFFAVMISGAAEKAIGQKNPKEIILDEFVAMPLCFFGLNLSRDGIAGIIISLSAGFIIFRLFDIFKPFGIKKLQNLPGGWGIVIDDLAAALGTCLSLHVLTIAARAGRIY